MMFACLLSQAIVAASKDSEYNEDTSASSADCFLKRRSRDAPGSSFDAQSRDPSPASRAAMKMTSLTVQTTPSSTVRTSPWLGSPISSSAIRGPHWGTVPPSPARRHRFCLSDALAQKDSLTNKQQVSSHQRCSCCSLACLVVGAAVACDMVQAYFDLLSELQSSSQSQAQSNIRIDIDKEGYVLQSDCRNGSEVDDIDEDDHAEVIPARYTCDNDTRIPMLINRCVLLLLSQAISRARVGRHLLNASTDDRRRKSTFRQCAHPHAIKVASKRKIHE